MCTKSSQYKVFIIYICTKSSQSSLYMSFWKCSDAERWGPHLFFCESAYLLSRKRLRGKMLHRIKCCLANVPLSCRTPEAHANWCKLIWRRRSCVCQCQLPRCPWWWTWRSIAEAWYEIHPCLYPFCSPFGLQIALLQVELFKKNRALLFSKRRDNSDCTKKKENLCHVQKKPTYKWSQLSFTFH